MTDPKPAPATDCGRGDRRPRCPVCECVVHGNRHYGSDRTHILVRTLKSQAASDRAENAKLRARVADLEEGLRGIETRLFGLAVDNPICQLHRMALSEIVDFIRAALKPEPASR